MDSNNVKTTDQILSKVVMVVYQYSGILTSKEIRILTNFGRIKLVNKACMCIYL